MESFNLDLTLLKLWSFANRFTIFKNGVDKEGFIALFTTIPSEVLSDVPKDVLKIAGSYGIAVDVVMKPATKGRKQVDFIKELQKELEDYLLEHPKLLLLQPLLDKINEGREESKKVCFFVTNRGLNSLFSDESMVEYAEGLIYESDEDAK